MGGSIFMSNALHRYAGNGGMWPGYGAMLSLAMSRRDMEYWNIPIIEEKDIAMGLDVLLRAAELLIPRCVEAAGILRLRKPSLSDEEIDRLAAAT
jgi:hypothetical protein